MNEQNLFGSIDIDKLFSLVQACPELVRTYTDKNGVAHHTVNVNVATRKQPSPNGHTHYIQVACKVADRKYDNSAYYIGDLKPSGSGGATSNQPPMPTATPWGAAPAPAPTAAPAPVAAAPTPAPAPAPTAPAWGAPAPAPGTPPFPPSQDGNTPF